MRDGAMTKKKIPVTKRVPLLNQELMRIIRDLIGIAIRPNDFFTRVSPYFFFLQPYVGQTASSTSLLILATEQISFYLGYNLTLSKNRIG